MVGTTSASSSSSGNGGGGGGGGGSRGVIREGGGSSVSVPATGGFASTSPSSSSSSVAAASASSFFRSDAGYSNQHHHRSISHGQHQRRMTLPVHAQRSGLSPTGSSGSRDTAGRSRCLTADADVNVARAFLQMKELQMKARGVEWCHNKDAVVCFHAECRARFHWLYRRRHHCRGCGGVFCESCTSWKRPLPALGYNYPVRVCQMCFQKDAPLAQAAPGMADGRNDSTCSGDTFEGNASVTDSLSESMTHRSIRSHATAVSATAMASSTRPWVYRPLWRPDSQAQHCFDCQNKFSMFTRRHHCRGCGNVFCNDCTRRRLTLEHIGYFHPVRVCVVCASPKPLWVSSVPTIGGLCTVEGRNFGSTARQVKVSLDGELCRDLQMVSRGSALQFEVPPGVGGGKHLTVVVGQEGLSGMIEFAYAQPVLHDVTPVSTYGGEIVITGANFGSEPDLVVVQWDPRAALAGAHSGGGSSTTPPLLPQMYEPIEEGEHESSFDRGSATSDAGADLDRSRESDSGDKFRPVDDGRALWERNGHHRMNVSRQRQQPWRPPRGGQLKHNASSLALSSSNPRAAAESGDRRWKEATDVAMLVEHTSIRAVIGPGTGTGIPIRVLIGGEEATAEFSYAAPSIMETSLVPFEGGWFDITGLNFGSKRRNIIVSIGEVKTERVKIVTPHTKLRCWIPPRLLRTLTCGR